MYRDFLAISHAKLLRKKKKGKETHLGRGLRLLDLPLSFEADSIILPL